MDKCTIGQTERNCPLESMGMNNRLQKNDYAGKRWAHLYSTKKLENLEQTYPLKREFISKPSSEKRIKDADRST
jgi:hypothetical protein